MTRVQTVPPLLKLYDSTIRSELDYGCMVYNGSPCDFYLKMLDPISKQCPQNMPRCLQNISNLQVYFRETSRPQKNQTWPSIRTATKI